MPEACLRHDGEGRQQALNKRPPLTPTLSPLSAGTGRGGVRWTRRAQRPIGRAKIANPQYEAYPCSTSNGSEITQTPLMRP